VKNPIFLLMMEQQKKRADYNAEQNRSLLSDVYQKTKEYNNRIKEHHAHHSTLYV